MDYADTLVRQAVTYLGIKENPSGSNNVIFNTEYYGKAVNGDAYAWCCTFVWYVFKKCKLSNIFYDGKKTAYCPDVYNWAKKNKLTVNKSQARAGDIILFDWNANGLPDHIGIVESYVNGTWNTIEGNTSETSQDNGGCVMRRKRKSSDILCVIRPKYPIDTKKDSDKMTTYTNRTGAALPVYSDSTLKNKIGILNVNASCTCLGVFDNRAVLYYKILSTGAHKVGFTDKIGGVGG